MRVIFHNNFFRNPTLYTKGVIYTIPDEWKDQLPSSVTILEDEAPAATPVPDKDKDTTEGEKETPEQTPAPKAAAPLRPKL